MNKNQFCMCITAADLPDQDRRVLSKPRAALLQASRWPANTQIRIKFLGGSAALQARVRRAAEEWLEFINLKFVFVTSGDADVRIAFQAGKGSWSYLGTVCRSIPVDQPTMNYGWLTDASDEADVRRVVLHEFGHAIGLIHEHQNPQHAIDWNKPAVIHDLSGPPNNWNLATIENNMFKFYAPSQVAATDVDANSIMMYPIPASWTNDGFSAELNSALSDDDKSLVKNVYPK